MKPEGATIREFVCGVHHDDFVIVAKRVRWDAHCPRKKTVSAFRHGEKCVHPNHPVPTLDLRALTRAISQRIRPLCL
jgi:hypothetical protein